MKLGLLHYTAAPLPGGVESVMASHARLFREQGHGVTVYAGEGEGEWLPVLRRAGVDVESLIEVLEPRLAREELVFLHNVCTMPFHPELTAALWELTARLPRVRFVAWVHDLALANPDYAVTDPIFRSACPRMEYVAVSPHRQREVEEHLQVPCRTIPNGVWADPLAFPERELVLLHPARLLRRKNLEFSLRVLSALRALGCDAVLLFTAPGDPHQADSARYAGELRQLRAALGLEEHAFFLPDLLPEAEIDLPRLYALADAVLFPSRQEGFGLPVLEAALHRVPIFCPEIEPLRSLLPGGPCLYPADSTPEEVAARMMQQLEGSAAIQARRSVLRGHTWPVIYRNYLAPLLAEKQTSSIPHP